MKRFLALIAVFFVLCSSVSAVELDGSSSDEQTSENVSKIDEIVDEVLTDSPVADVSVQEVPSVSSEQTSEVVSEIEKIVEEVLTDSPVADVSGQEVPSGSSVSEVSSGGNTFYVLDTPASTGFVDYGSLTDIPVGASIDNITFSSVSPIEPNDTTGLKSAILGVLGSYDPVVVEYQYSDGDGRTRYLREVQPDYVWLCSCALLALVIYCLFRLGGALIRD